MVPMGQLVSLLGCGVKWSPTRLGVQHPIHGKLKVRIVGHCPVIPVSQALGLIAELEQARMREFEKTVEDLQSQFTGLRGAGRDQWTWQRHLEALREDGERASMAGFLHRCPSFAMNVASGKCCWVKSMPWSRSKRKALFQSDGWIVNFLFFSKDCRLPESQQCAIMKRAFGTMPSQGTMCWLR